MQIIDALCKEQPIAWTDLLTDNREFMLGDTS